MHFELTRLSSRGQIVIPEVTRKVIGLRTGTKFAIFTDGKNILLQPLAAPDVAGFKKIIAEAKTDFPYPKSLASTLLETAHDQQFFSEHLPKLTDNHIEKIEHKKYVLDYLRFITFNQIK